MIWCELSFSSNTAVLLSPVMIWWEPSNTLLEHIILSRPLNCIRQWWCGVWLNERQMTSLPYFGIFRRRFSTSINGSRYLFTDCFWKKCEGHFNQPSSLAFFHIWFRFLLPFSLSLLGTFEHIYPSGLSVYIKHDEYGLEGRWRSYWSATLLFKTYYYYYYAPLVT